LGGRKGIWPVKYGGDGGGGQLSPDGVASSRMVVGFACDNIPGHYKVQRFSSGTGSPGRCQKKGLKTVVVWCVDNKH